MPGRTAWRSPVAAEPRARPQRPADRRPALASVPAPLRLRVIASGGGETLGVAVRRFVGGAGRFVEFAADLVALLFRERCPQLTQFSRHLALIVGCLPQRVGRGGRVGGVQLLGDGRLLRRQLGEHLTGGRLLIEPLLQIRQRLGRFATRRRGFLRLLRGHLRGRGGGFRECFRPPGLEDRRDVELGQVFGQLLFAGE